MRIAHVVTYVSPEGEFGGPVSVALGQARALAELGHDVTVFAGAPPSESGVRVADGYTLRTFPARRVPGTRGFAFMFAPGLSRALRNAAVDFDAVHLHLARDLVTLPAALSVLRRGSPYFVQPHGMIDASRKILAKPLDLLWTRKVLAGAQTVLTLTERETDEIGRLESRASTTPIVNGVQIGETPPLAHRQDLVLFMARLHPRKRPVAFVEMARLLAQRLPGTRFLLAGPDEGEANAVQDAIAQSGLRGRVDWLGAVEREKTQDLLAAARVYVLPAYDEVFPMSILESMQAGTPVVTTSSLGMAAMCEEFGAAVITDGSPEQLSVAVSRIMDDPEVAHSLRAGAERLLAERLDVRKVGMFLEDLYRRSVRVR